MAARSRGLGRGLDALIAGGGPAAGGGSVPPATTATGETPRELPVSAITANPFQPRQHFDEAALEELVASIRELGILQPLLVRRVKGGKTYQLIAGERRFRAAQRANLSKVPVVVRDLSDQEALEIALVENLQRHDLNPIEEAEGYGQLATAFHLTQEDIAQRVGKNRSTVANALRLLSLPPPVREMVAQGLLSSGHAKALLGLEIPKEQELLATEVVRQQWSVRETEKRVAALRNPGKRSNRSRAARLDIPADHLQYLTDRLHQHLGTSVRVQPSRTLPNGKKQRGKVEIDFYSNDDLDRLLGLLGLSEES